MIQHQECLQQSNAIYILQMSPQKKNESNCISIGIKYNETHGRVVGVRHKLERARERGREMHQVNGVLTKFRVYNYYYYCYIRASELGKKNRGEREKKKS